MMLYTFGACVLDTQLYVLSRAGQPVKLRPKAFAVLVYLVEHHDRVVSKDELCAQVWPNQFISDATLGSTVRAVRQAIGDTGEAQQLIQTVHGYGYRCIASVTVGPARRAAPAAAVAPPVLATLVPSPARGAVEPSAMALEQPSAQPGQPSAALTLLRHGERKVVTVLCCTLAPSSAVRGQSDLDSVHSLMWGFYGCVREAVQQYGGALKSPMGDRVLVVFGAPVAQEDHAVRAGLAALAIQQRLDAWRHTAGVPADVGLAVRIGLHTGHVAIGRLGEDPELLTALVGDVTARAVALQEQAEPGVIYCSEATAHLVQGRMYLTPVALAPLPGPWLPERAYRLNGVERRRTPRGQPQGRGLSPFVGREREMATLHALLARVEAGRGQVVRVVGEAGIGKSRLLSEFRHSLQGRALTYLTGRCVSYGSATPYLPLLDLLRHCCGITTADGPAAITAKVHHSLQAVGMPLETWAPVFLSLLGVPEGMQQLAAFSPEARKARILVACTQLCLNGSRQRPLVLAIEDLHWIDASSEACLMALVERMAGAQLLLLVTSRQGYQPPWIDKSYATQLALTPLDPQGSRRVVQARRGTLALSEPTLAAIVARANGNPLFLEELAHTVVEGATSSRQAVLPITLQAVLTARIDRLVPEAKRLLQVAAVIGKHIPLSLLQAVVEMPAEVLQQHLNHLQSAELLYETTWDAAPTVTFKHVLIQEAAYQALLQETRQQVHRQIAQMLREQYPQLEAAQPEWLAHHYTEAGLRKQAIVYWQRAGQYALDRSAYVEAMAHLRQGLLLTAALPDTPERRQHELLLYMTLGVTLATTQGYAAPNVEHTYLQARECCRQLGEPAPLFTVLRGLWLVYLTRAELPRAYEQGVYLLRLAQHHQEPALLVEAYRALEPV